MGGKFSPFMICLWASTTAGSTAEGAAGSCSPDKIVPTGGAIVAAGAGGIDGESEEEAREAIDNSALTVPIPCGFLRLAGFPGQEDKSERSPEWK